MKFTVTYKRSEYATVEIEAESWKDAEAKAEDLDVDESYWEPSDYYGGEVCVIFDEEGNGQYYG